MKRKKIKRKEKPLRLLFSAGGTGGHLFPAQKIARHLKLLHPNIECLFVASGLSKSPYFSKEEFQYKDIASATIRWKQWYRLPLFLYYIVKGLVQVSRLFRIYKPQFVIGFGSFHTFPVLLMAKWKNIPYSLMEANIQLGIVNRFFATSSQSLGLYFPIKERKFHPKSKYIHFASRKTLDRNFEAFGLQKGQFTVLVAGGSQGALFINQNISLFMQCLQRKLTHFQVIHLTGQGKKTKELEEVYQEMGIPVCLKEFEENMERVWNIVDLVLCRSGANMLQEIIEYSIPAILIPFPYDKKYHQFHNASFLVETIQGGICLEQHQVSQQEIDKLFDGLFSQNAKKLLEMKEAMQKYAKKQNKVDSTTFIQEELSQLGIYP